MFKENLSEERIINYLNYALEAMYDIRNLTLKYYIVNDNLSFLISYEVFQNGKWFTLNKEISKANLGNLVKLGYRLLHHKPINDVYIYIIKGKIKYQAITLITDNYVRGRKR